MNANRFFPDQPTGVVLESIVSPGVQVLSDYDKPKQHYTAPHQTFVTIPNAAHATIEESPDVDPGKSSCGMQVMASYLKAPTQAPDVSCLDTLLPISFDSYPETNMTVWGTSDMWDNAPAPVAPARRSALDDRAGRAIRRPHPRRFPLR